MTTNTLTRTTSRASTLLREGAIAVAGAAAVTAAGQVEVPFYPVPMTLQTLAVLGLGLGLGLRRSLGAMGLFLALGGIGLPVFAGGSGGLAVLFGPTGGYLIGFVVAAAFCGWARDRGWTKQVLGSTAVALIGAALVYPTGLLQLAAVVGWDKPVLAWGLYPFVLGDLLKAMIAGLGAVAITRVRAG